MIRLGIECEGIYKGLPTLYIAETSDSEIHTAFMQQRFAHVYLGADYARPKWEQVKYVLDLIQHNPRPVTIEISIEDAADVPVSLLGKIRFILRVNTNLQSLKYFKDVDQIKVETTEDCHVFTIGSAIQNEKNYLDKQIP